MSTAATVAVQSNPFPGLRPFREEEEYLFFGRESQVDAMVDKLAATHFLAVVGTSGSGKSSMVNCGMRSALYGGLMVRAGTAWRMAQFRPGSEPLGALARALAQDGVLFRDYQAGGLKLAEIIDTTLRMSKLGLIDIYEQAQLGEDVNLLVVVDQFEELFRYQQLGSGQDEKVSGLSEAATAFVNLLLEAKEQTTCPIYVVLTMRSDFLGDCAQFAGLAEAINAGQYLVPRMTRDERRAAISGPVGVGGAEIAPVLLTRLVNDVGDNPDQLSILQHALNRTWARWQHEGGGDGPLDLAHYQAIGTMAHALDQHAEKAYAELGTARQQRICEKLFKALTDKATDPRGVRRPTTLGTLCALADATAAEVTEVIDVFRKPSRSFLMPPAGETLKTETVIDISHESLMRVWQRLITWADEEARSARTYRRLADTAALHAAKEANLWRDPDLQLALDWRHQTKPNEAWASRYHPGFAAAMRFLEASVKLREGEEKGLDSNMMQRLELFGYEIEEQIGEGGFGKVYKARHVAEGYTVALKMFAGDAEQSVAERELFARECEVIAQLNNESIVSVLEVHHEACPAIFVMEWVDGLPITTALQGADWDTKAGAVAMICDSIKHAHQQGVVHGDLKPNNLLVGSDGKPKVLDFGVSRFLADEDDLLRRSSSGVGRTALYMAPEQVVGQETVGSAIDVYALGVVLYELLTGEPPFAANRLHGVLDAPELPMLKREDVPEPLQRICLKALEKRPADRYRSMSEMREDLERYRQGKPVSVRPSYYNNLIESPARGHVTEIDRWHNQALITDGEHVRLRRAYQGLTRSGLQAVSESRLVHSFVLLLYLSGWLVLAGATLWLILHHSKPEADLWLANWLIGRVLISLVPALLANGLWRFFNRRGSYRFAFAAMIVGLLSLPFAVGFTVHEIASDKGLNIAALQEPVDLKCMLETSGQSGGIQDDSCQNDHQIFRGDENTPFLPNIQLFIALMVAVVWGAYVALQSQTLTSATIVGVQFVALYLIGLDFWGLKYFFDERISAGGLFMLPAAVALFVAGVWVGQKLKRPGQTVPLFAIAMVVAILASQAIAIKGPEDWEWKYPEVGTGAIEVALGIAYLFASRYLRDRFRVEAASAYLVLAWLAPVAFLGGIGLMDHYWELSSFTFLDKTLTPWALVLLASSIIVVLLAAMLQSHFYIICGNGFLIYILSRIAFLPPPNWGWTFTIMATGLVVMAWLTWRDWRERVGEDIDDVGELLIRRSRLASSTADEKVNPLKR